MGQRKSPEMAEWERAFGCYPGTGRKLLEGVLGFSQQIAFGKKI